jgi:hypothetical protein
MREATHSDPAWRDRSNFIIATDIDPGETDIDTEQLWARKLDDGAFEICCIPFFAYNLSLGDVVLTDADYMVRNVVKESGYRSFRVAVFWPKNRNDDILESILRPGVFHEWSSPKLLALSANSKEMVKYLTTTLDNMQNDKMLHYELSRI